MPYVYQTYNHSNSELLFRFKAWFELLDHLYTQLVSYSDPHFVWEI